MDVWTIVDETRSDSGFQRAEKVREWVNRADEGALNEFHQSAVHAYRAIFNNKMLRLYCLIFCGRTNESGFSDFISNLILFGSEAYSTALKSPDDLVQIAEIFNWDEDFGINVAEVALPVLEKKRNDRELTMSDEMLPSLEGVWSQIATPGSDMFEVDFENVSREFPKCFSRFCKREKL